MKRKSFSLLLGIVGAATGLLCISGSAYCDDDGVSMAPPVGQSVDSSPNQGNVFNWSKVPQGQQVPIDRGVFDEGGYQLYDSVGETIVVPFSHQNLYVMKFAISDNGTMYFVNNGDTPILYVPRGGYLENAAVSGARWYPFSHGFHPATPVYLGIAPSWSAYVDMGWYPGMYCYGGYWGHTSFISGGLFLPSIGLFFNIGGHPYYGWGGYRSYYHEHEGFTHIGFYNRNVYHWAGRSFRSDRTFGGGPRGFGGDHNFGGHGFAGAGHNFGGGHGFSGGSNRQFGGATGGHGFGGGGTHSFGGANGGHAFGGGGSHSFGGANGGHAFGGGGSHSFGGANGGHAFGGGGSHSFGGAAGGHAAGGDRGDHGGGGADHGGGGGGDRGGGGGDRHDR